MYLSHFQPFHLSLCNELLLRGIVLITLCGDLCKTVLRTSINAGRMSSSPTVCGFPDLAINNEMSDARKLSVFCCEALQNMLDSVGRI
jgi:hypothetical protein